MIIFFPRLTCCVKVHLIALPKNVRELCFYKASIPEEFLDKFDEPSRYFSCKPVVISYCSIPLQQTSTAASAIDQMISAISDEGREMAMRSEEKSQ